MSRKSGTILNRRLQLQIVVALALTSQLLAGPITISSDAPGNVFVTGRRLSFDVRLDKAAPLELAVQNHTGTNVWARDQAVARQAITVEVPELGSGLSARQL